jgi:hypothetical protein
MWISLPAAEVLDREFLAARARLIELAAVLDRVQRADGPKPPEARADDRVDDRRLDQIRQSLQLLAEDAPDRAEKLQLLFSLPYDDDWQAQYGLR